MRASLWSTQQRACVLCAMTEKAYKTTFFYFLFFSNTLRMWMGWRDLSWFYRALWDGVKRRFHSLLSSRAFWTSAYRWLKWFCCWNSCCRAGLWVYSKLTFSVPFHCVIQGGVGEVIHVIFERHTQGLVLRILILAVETREWLILTSNITQRRGKGILELVEKLRYKSK